MGIPAYILVMKHVYVKNKYKCKCGWEKVVETDCKIGSVIKCVKCKKNTAKLIK